VRATRVVIRVAVVVKRLAWLLPVAMTAVVYYPITRNYFLSDDFLNFWYLVNEGLPRSVLRLNGGHSHVTRNLIIALFHTVFGVNPLPYFILALLTHLLNVFLLFEVVRWLTASRRVACVAAGMWGIAPVHQGTLGWFAVYGQALAGTCALWVLVGLARCRAGQPVRALTPWLWAAAMIGGGLSFGVGLGVALVMPAIAWLLLPAGRQRTHTAVVLAGAAIATTVLYFGQQRLYQALYQELPAPPLSAYALHDLWREQAGFLVSLASYGIVALLLGAFNLANDYPSVLGIVVLCAAALCTGIAVGRAPAGTARPLLACAVFAVGAYALIAIARALFVTPATVLSSGRTLRYQYVGPIADAIAIGIVLNALVGRWQTPAWLTNGALGIWAGGMLAAALWAVPPFAHFDVARKETADVLKVTDTLVAAAPAGADVYIKNRPFGPIGYFFFTHMEAFPGWAAVFAMFHPTDVVNGHRVHFVIDDADTLARAQHGRRAPALLCGPPGATPDAAAPGDR
jgi:hypothetical protein